MLTGDVDPADPGRDEAGSWTPMSPDEVADPPGPLLAFDADGEPIAAVLPPEAVWLVHPEDRALRADTAPRVLVASRLPLTWKGWRLVQLDLSGIAWLELDPAGEDVPATAHPRPQDPVTGNSGQVQLDQPPAFPGQRTCSPPTALSARSARSSVEPAGARPRAATPPRSAHARRRPRRAEPGGWVSYSGRQWGPDPACIPARMGGVPRVGARARTDRAATAAAGPGGAAATVRAASMTRPGRDGPPGLLRRRFMVPRRAAPWRAAALTNPVPALRRSSAAETAGSSAASSCSGAPGRQPRVFRQGRSGHCRMGEHSLKRVARRGRDT